MIDAEDDGAVGFRHGSGFPEIIVQGREQITVLLFLILFLVSVSGKNRREEIPQAVPERGAGDTILNLTGDGFRKGGKICVFRVDGNRAAIVAGLGAGDGIAGRPENLIAQLIGVNINAGGIQNPVDLILFQSVVDILSDKPGQRRRNPYFWPWQKFV